MLGDWYEQGSVLRWNERGFELAGAERRGRSTCVNAECEVRRSRDADSGSRLYTFSA